MRDCDLLAPSWEPFLVFVASGAEEMQCRTPIIRGTVSRQSMSRVSSSGGTYQSAADGPNSAGFGFRDRESSGATRTMLDKEACNPEKVETK